MAGLGTSLVHNIYPAEFAAISRNITNQQAMAAQGFAASSLQTKASERRMTVDGEFMRTNENPGGDGSGYLPSRRRRGAAPPPPHELEQLAGEGNMLDLRL